MPLQIGLLLSPEHHAQMIADGNKKLIVKAERFYRYTRIPIYLLADQKCYAKIVLSQPKEISLSQFRGLRSRHRITEKERLDWWPKRQNFFAYEFQVLETYDPPKQIQFKPRSQAWVRRWKWIDTPPKELRLEKIADLASYNPSSEPDTKRGNARLRDDARIILAWYSSKKAGKEIPYDYELLEKKYIALLKVLIKRNAAKFRPWTYKSVAKELFNKARKVLEKQGIEIPLRKAVPVISPQQIRELSSEELLELHKRLHDEYSKKPTGSALELIVNTHIFVMEELERRDLKHEPIDQLDQELKIQAKRKLVPFIIIDSFVSHTGSAVYEKDIPADHDFVIRAGEDAPYYEDVILKMVGIPSEHAHRVYDERGPSFDFVPLLDLAAIPVGWRGIWPVKKPRQQPEDIPDASWQIYKKFPPALLVDRTYVILDGEKIIVREPKRNSGVELKLRRLLGDLSFKWNLEDSPSGKVLYRTYLVPHVPLERKVINEPLFKPYYTKRE